MLKRKIHEQFQQQLYFLLVHIHIHTHIHTLRFFLRNITNLFFFLPLIFVFSFILSKLKKIGWENHLQLKIKKDFENLCRKD